MYPNDTPGRQRSTASSIKDVSCLSGHPLPPNCKHRYDPSPYVANSSHEVTEHELRDGLSQPNASYRCVWSDRLHRGGAGLPRKGGRDHRPHPLVTAANDRKTACLSKPDIAAEIYPPPRPSETHGKPPISRFRFDIVPRRYPGTKRPKSVVQGGLCASRLPPFVHQGIISKWRSRQPSLLSYCCLTSMRWSSTNEMKLRRI